MNLAGIDLNLLVVFDALMEERSVTRAGRRIGMTQPAVSNALNRLRHLLKDDLFLRGPKGMRPTPRAVELARPVRQALSQIDLALRPVEFDPGRAANTFRLAMADYAASLILPPLAHRLEREAPGVNIRVRINDNVSAPGLLDRNEIDFAIGYHSEWPERFGGQVLFTETYVCVMRRGHPLARDRITLEEFASARHLLVTLTGEATGFVDRLLKKRGLERRVAMTANQFLVAPLIIQNSDMIMTLALRTAERFAEVNKLHIVPVPLEPDPIDLTLLWHKELIRHPAHEWMRALLVEICRTV
ncbi:MAG TPA: LysR family transcriptional regulator [Alphaproteobacteria bacterium]|nr:LysR family transcriptional regulator [Alphaproteobacteria bacterium]